MGCQHMKTQGEQNVFDNVLWKQILFEVLLDIYFCKIEIPKYTNSFFHLFKY